MPRKISHFKLGLLILVGGAIGLGVVIWLGASHFFEETKMYVTYFDESVKGLQQGAVVNYRGVAVGRAASISVAPDGRLIEVEMPLRADFQVTENMVIQLREQGLTGLRYLEIDHAPESMEEMTPKLTFEPPYPLIPSIPSEFAQLKTAFETIYMQIQDLDLRAFTEQWTRTAELLNDVLVQVKGSINPEDWRQLVRSMRETAQAASALVKAFAGATQDGNLQKTFKDLTAVLESTRQIAAALEAQLEELPPGAIAELHGSLEETAKLATDLFTTLDRQLTGSATLTQQTLQQFRTLLTRLNSLVQAVQQRPGRLLFPSESENPFSE